MSSTFSYCQLLTPVNYCQTLRNMQLPHILTWAGQDGDRGSLVYCNQCVIRFNLLDKRALQLSHVL